MARFGVATFFPVVWCTLVLVGVGAAVGLWRGAWRREKEGGVGVRLGNGGNGGGGSGGRSVTPGRRGRGGGEVVGVRKVGRKGGKEAGLGFWGFLVLFVVSLGGLVGMRQVDVGAAFAGRRVLVVGASRGIGAELGLQLCRSGAKVALSSRSGGPLRSLAQQCRELGGEAVDIARDVSAKGGAEEVVKGAVRALGGLDVVFANHAIFDKAMLLEYANADDAQEKAQQILNTNVASFIAIARAAIPYLHESSGAFYITSSGTAALPCAFRSFYVASKRALHGWADSLRFELKLAKLHNVHIGILVLGMIATPEVLADPGNAAIAIPVPQCASDMLFHAAARATQAHIPPYLAPFATLNFFLPQAGQAAVKHTYIANSNEFQRRIDALDKEMNAQ